MARRSIDCGIDIGSTNVKVVLVADERDIVCARAMPSPRVDGGVGPATDALALVAALEAMILDAWRDTAEGLPLRSIACAGIGEDGLGLDVAGAPTGLSIPWFDARSAPEAAELAAAHDVIDRTGHAITADKTAAKWLWIHRHRPAERAASATWVALTDFPAVHWTGTPFLSASLAPRTACFDVRYRAWIPSLLTASQAPPLPPVRAAGTALGPVRRGRLLSAGAVDAATVVAVGGHDHPVAARAIRALEPTALVDSLGTANLVYAETPALIEGYRPHRLSVSVPPDGGAAYALLGVLEFAAALQATGAPPETIATFMARDAAPPSPTDATDHDADMARLGAAIDAQCRLARDILAEMSALGVPDAPLYATGGWSRARGFMARRAQILGRPLHVIDAIELSALGAAQFAIRAATGREPCLLRRDDVRLIEPVGVDTGP